MFSNREQAGDYANVKRRAETFGKPTASSSWAYCDPGPTRDAPAEVVGSSSFTESGGPTELTMVAYVKGIQRSDG
jgi:hypothetical protein